MINLLLAVFLFSSTAWSRVTLELILDTASVKQGEIATGKLVVKQAEGQTGLAGLKGKNIGKTLYLLHVSPFMGKQGQLESEAKVIFFVVPQVNAVTEVINGEDVFISWNNIEVIPTETSKSFLLGDFEIPERKKIVKWFLILLMVGVIAGLALWINRYFKRKSISREKTKLLKNELTNCMNYDDIVLMWRQKHRYLVAFPGIESCFKSFEEILFKYQFKSSRSESEIQEVISAYQKFKTDVQGVLNEI
ncbi:MAG: hypothetical protein H0V66_13335 [Bdellovibrionales bacterium]|nr:hypothetical protein [Bdellovibrionales bacterium]